MTGLEVARRETPDVILLDVMMPGMDGWDVFGELLEDERTANIPVVFLTARAELRDQARGLELGGVDYVTKPFDPLELAPLIDDLLERIERGAVQERRRERLAALRQLLVND
jgi:DNA-binding response OmpR family regulator